MGHDPNTRPKGILLATAALWTLLAGGCASHQPVPPAPQRPDLKPTRALDRTQALTLDASDVKPMYTEMLAVDLPTVVRVAAAENFDIRQARQAVIASQGRLESAVGAAFPVIVPTALFEHVEGTVRATEGNLVGVGFNTFQPSVAVQWVINPGRVVYDIIAAKKRLAASADNERSVVLETLRRSVVEFYDLVLAQARVSAARQGVAEAEELLRINQLRTRTGTGVPADELRAEARLAERRQDLITAMRSFYDASVALAFTLHLNASVTLVPNIKELPPTYLVRNDLDIEELLGFAVAFRPDLQRVRTLVEAITADKGATWWGAFGPQFEAGFQYGGITGHADDVVPTETLVGGATVATHDDQTFGFSDQLRADARVGWRLSVSAFGDLKTAAARQEQAHLQAQRKLDRVHAEVVTANQASKANNELLGLSGQQVAAAAEALRLTEANLRAGTMTTLDVLQAQDAVTQARLRHAEAVVRYNQSQVNLLAALGLLDEQTLSPASSNE
ncbi:MAG: TolC family protein [Phycisphaerae bacterium]